MTDPQAPDRLGAIAQKWRELAERRRADFTELYKSGHWKRYYTEAEFIARMREIICDIEMWAKLAPRPSETASQQPDKTESRASPPRKTAA